MLYFSVGSDFEKRKKKTDGLVSAMQKKRPDAQLVVLDPTAADVVAQLQQQIAGIGLFDEKTITKALGLCEEKEIKDFIFGHLSELSESANAFVLSELSLTKTEIGKIEKSGGEVFQFEDTEKTNTHNLFYLGDLLLRRNKSQLWVSIQKELMKGTSIEELFGILMWQAKSLHLSKTMSQTESGLKPFVYNKCVKSDWTVDQAQQLHKDLVTIYHQSRRGGLTLTEQLERLILGL